MVTSLLASLLLLGSPTVVPTTQTSSTVAQTVVAQSIYSFASPFSSKDGRFSITLPEGYTKPKLETSDVPSEIGKIKLYMYTSMNIVEGVCLVGYSDITGIEMSADLKEKMLEGAKEGALGQMNATLEGEETISIDGHPGRSLVFTAESEGQTMKGRFDYYMVGSRLYQIGFIALAEDALTSDGIQSYFSSFKLMAAKAKAKKGKK